MQPPVFKLVTIFFVMTNEFYRLSGNMLAETQSRSAFLGIWRRKENEE